MKIIYKSYMARPAQIGEWDWEVREAVKTALALVEGKNGFKTHSEIWRRCNLVITVGTTSTPRVSRYDHPSRT